MKKITNATQLYKAICASDKYLTMAFDDPCEIQWVSSSEEEDDDSYGLVYPPFGNIYFAKDAEVKEIVDDVFLCDGVQFKDVDGKWHTVKLYKRISRK